MSTEDKATPELMSGDEPEVPIICGVCDTQTRVSLADAADAIERHNRQLHDGNEHAQVDPDVADELLSMVAEDLELLDQE